jgi:hypothetical protein
MKAVVRDPQVAINDDAPEGTPPRQIRTKKSGFKKTGLAPPCFGEALMRGILIIRYVFRAERKPPKKIANSE